MNCRQWVVDVILVQTPSRWRHSSQFSVLSCWLSALSCQFL